MTGRDAEREQLAAAVGAGRQWWGDELHEILADLLPVVDRIANERAAAALAEMAQAARKPCGWGVRAVDAADLRTRAAALRASNGTGTT